MLLQHHGSTGVGDVDRSPGRAAVNAGAGLAFLAMLAGLAGCAAPVGAPGDATSALATTPAETPAGAVSALPAGITPLALDTQTADCEEVDRFAVFRLAKSESWSTGDAFHSLFPAALLTPELDTVHGDTIVVIYVLGWPGPYFVVPGSQTDGRRSPDPGTWDVCLEAPDNSLGEPYIVYANVPSADSPASALTP
jgi:hypothetical protein